MRHNQSCFGQAPLPIQGQFFLWLRLWRTARGLCRTYRLQVLLLPAPCACGWAADFLFCYSRTSGAALSNPPRRKCSHCWCSSVSCPSLGQWHSCQLYAIIMGTEGSGPNNACTRLSLRAVFNSYFCVVIAFRGASAVRRNRPAGDAPVRRVPCTSQNEFSTKGNTDQVCYHRALILV